MEGDELELEKIGDRKTALFCIVSDTDMTFNFISAMVYTQMFNVLCDKALENGGALKTHVTCLLDEFANQKIPNFQHLISVIRSREISAHIVVQTQSQLKAVCGTTMLGSMSAFRRASSTAVSSSRGRFCASRMEAGRRERFSSSPKMWSMFTRIGHSGL